MVRTRIVHLDLRSKAGIDSEKLEEPAHGRQRIAGHLLKQEESHGLSSKGVEKALHLIVIEAGPEIQKVRVVLAMVLEKPRIVEPFLFLRLQPSGKEVIFS